MLFTGCTSLTGKKATTTTTTPTTTTATQALQDRIAAAESRIAGLESQGNSTKTDVDSLLDRLTVLEGQTGGVDNSAEIADLQDQIDALTDEIDALEEGDSDSGNSTPTNNEAIRWRFEQPAFYSKTGTYLSGLEGYLREDTRVKDEDIYYIALWVRATPDAIINRTQFYITLTLKPSSSSDYALLSDSTYMDTDDIVLIEGSSTGRIPEPSWEADFQTKTREGAEVTRKVVFESSIITIEDLDVGNNSFSDHYIYFPLVLELYYAD